MKKIALSPEMSKREFEEATKMKVKYRDKGKTGVSFKINGLCHLREEDAREKAETLEKRFSGCTVKVMRANMPSFMTGNRWNVRIVLPLSN